MAENQVYLFSIFTIVGIIIGILFDIFRIIRRIIKTNNIITYIEDILFFLITEVIIIYSMYKFCNGEIRFFMIAGIGIGSVMYFFTISKYIINVSVYIINMVCKILIFPISIIVKISKKIVYNPIKIICINLKKYRKNVMLAINKQNKIRKCQKK